MSERKIFISLIIILIIGLLLPVHVKSAPEKKLIVAVGQEPSSMDPSLMVIGGDYTVVENWGEYLIHKAPNGDLQPGLATSWKVSPDGKEMEFTLRKGVKFHSGDFLTSKDVQFSFERGRAKNPVVRILISMVERFEIIDDYQFKLHFKKPDGSFLPLRAAIVGIVSKSYYDRVGEDKFVKQGVGTGPYKLVHHASGEYVDLERFEDYWGEKPSVKEARFLFIPEDTTRLAKLKAGEVDITNNCPYPSVKDVERDPGLKVTRLATNHPTISILFSTRNPKTPWHDKRVRLAMAYAIDCDAIIKNVLYGIPNHWAFLAPYELGYDPELKPYPYNPKKARELLAEAGYPNGFEFKFYWPITGRFPMSRETAEVIASYFEAVGIKTRLVGEEWLAALSRLRASKGPEVEYVNLWAGGRAGSPDASYFMDLFYSADGGFSVYYNPEADKVILEARGTWDDTKRGDLIKKAVRMIHEDVATIPIFNVVNVYAMKKNIDFKPTQKWLMDLLLAKDVTMR